MKMPLALLAGTLFAGSLAAADIALPPPKKSGGMALSEALALRKSTRAFLTRALSEATLSSLLWSAAGVNRPDGRRTAPSALDRREISIYVVMTAAVYRYDAPKHHLVEVNRADYAVDNGAPLLLVYVADLSKQELDYARVDAGFIGQNVYLFAAANELGCVFKGSFDGDRLKPHLKLTADQRILYVQPIGYPK